MPIDKLVTAPKLKNASPWTNAIRKTVKEVNKWRCGSLMRSSYNFLMIQLHVMSIHFRCSLRRKSNCKVSKTFKVSCSQAPAEWRLETDGKFCCMRRLHPLGHTGCFLEYFFNNGILCKAVDGGETRCCDVGTMHFVLRNTETVIFSKLIYKINV